MTFNERHHHAGTLCRVIHQQTESALAWSRGEAGDFARGITVTLMGGLANQLFIYGAGLGVALRLNCPLYLDTSWFETQDLRRFELDAFDHQGVLVKRPSESRSRLPFPLSRLSKPRQRVYMFREKSFRYQSTTNVPLGSWMFGYFQSWKYLEPVADQIRSEVSNLTAPSRWFLEKSAMLTEYAPWTALHIRRGDYLNPGTLEYHGIAGIEYYTRSLAAIRSMGEQGPVMVFSDDLNASRKLLDGIDGDFEFVDPPPESRPLESLMLQSYGHSAIIANSSFSWWGAWMSDHPSKVVVAPRPWLDDFGTNDRDLLPPHWLTIGR